MKNYDLILESELQKITKSGETPTLLLHACCAPCSSAVLERISKYFKITILYYNPNIAPKAEFDKRVHELDKFLKEFKTENKVDLIEDYYDYSEYTNAVKGLEHLGERSKRCYECYKLRMERCAKYAKEHNFDYFTTTLSISPYKDSNWINEIGSMLQDKYQVKYLYADFKKKNGYLRSIKLSHEYNLYRQGYCGCAYSYEEYQKRISTKMD
jgi:epoxyqueuosine reductase